MATPPKCRCLVMCQGSVVFGFSSYRPPGQDFIDYCDESTDHHTKTTAPDKDGGTWSALGDIHLIWCGSRRRSFGTTPMDFEPVDHHKTIIKKKAHSSVRVSCMYVHTSVVGSVPVEEQPLEPANPDTQTRRQTRRHVAFSAVGGGGFHSVFGEIPIPEPDFLARRPSGVPLTLIVIVLVAGAIVKRIQKFATCRGNLANQILEKLFPRQVRSRTWLSFALILDNNGYAAIHRAGTTAMSERRNML
eukprot:5793224-Amphidinium_carterae.1